MLRGVLCQRGMSTSRADSVNPCRVSYLSTKAEAGSESDWAYKRLSEEYASQIFVTVWLNVFQQCTCTQNGLCMHAFPGSLPPSTSTGVWCLLMYLPLFAVLIPNHKSRCHFQPGHSVPVFNLSLCFPGPATSVPEFNTDGSLSLWSGIHRDRECNGVSQSLREETLFSTGFSFGWDEGKIQRQTDTAVAQQCRCT